MAKAMKTENPDFSRLIAVQSWLVRLIKHMDPKHERFFEEHLKDIDFRWLRARDSNSDL